MLSLQIRHWIMKWLLVDLNCVRGLFVSVWSVWWTDSCCDRMKWWQVNEWTYMNRHVTVVSCQYWAYWRSNPQTPVWSVHCLCSVGGSCPETDGRHTCSLSTLTHSQWRSLVSLGVYGLWCLWCSFTPVYRWRSCTDLTAADWGSGSEFDCSCGSTCGRTVHLLKTGSQVGCCWVITKYIRVWVWGQETNPPLPLFPEGKEWNKARLQNAPAKDLQVAGVRFIWPVCSI